MHFSGSTNVYEDNMGVIIDTVFDVELPPEVPADLKAKKINLKEAKSKLMGQETEKPKTAQEILDQIEDVLFDEGLIDLDDESQFD